MSMLRGTVFDPAFAGRTANAVKCSAGFLSANRLTARNMKIKLKDSFCRISSPVRLFSSQVLTLKRTVAGAWLLRLPKARTDDSSNRQVGICSDPIGGAPLVAKNRAQLKSSWAKRQLKAFSKG